MMTPSHPHAGLNERMSTGKAPVDLLLRTGGEARMSNFLLWQTAYAEIVIVDDLWPDMTASRMRAVFETYRNRQRRFGL